MIRLMIGKKFKDYKGQQVKITDIIVSIDPIDSSLSVKIQTDKYPELVRAMSLIDYLTETKQE